MANKGFIKISRDLLNDGLWADSDNPFTLREVLLDLAIRVNHTAKSGDKDNSTYYIKRGQITDSLENFGKHWHMCDDTASKRLDELVKLKLIRKEKIKVGQHEQTLITLINYDKEQGSGGNGLRMPTPKIDDTAPNNCSVSSSGQSSVPLSEEDSVSSSALFKNDKECSNNATTKNKEGTFGAKGTGMRYEER